MKHFKTFAALLTGMILGAVLSDGTAVLAAAELAAAPSGQAIYLNGEKVSMAAFSIGGSNYVRLRDIGKALNISVVYDVSDNSVRIDTGKPYAVETTAANADGSLNLPQSDAKLTLSVGDVVRCADGTNYTIKDLSHRREDPGPLPTAACDWSKFPIVTLPKAEARRYQRGGVDYLFVRNLYETRRMQYTLYNAVGANPQTWRDGSPVLRGDGSPLVRAALEIPQGAEPQSFWPWRASEITDDFNACPPGFYQFEAWDVYADGAFLYTEYDVCVS